MVSRRPLVTEDGLVSELLQGDTVQTGGSSNEVIAGSGLVGGGVIGPNTRLDFAVAPNPSGLIYAGDSLGNDGVSFVNATNALSSGNAALADSVDALASGNAALSIGTEALASGNAALGLVPTLGGGSNTTVLEAASAVASGVPVGVDDTGRVQAIEGFVELVTPEFQTGSSWQEVSSNTNNGTEAYNKLIHIANQTNKWAWLDRTASNNYIYGQVYYYSGSNLQSGTDTVLVSAACNSVAADWNPSTNCIVEIHTQFAGDAGRVLTWTESSFVLGFQSSDAITTSYYPTNNFIVSSTTDPYCLLGYSSSSQCSFRPVEITSSSAPYPPSLGNQIDSTFAAGSAMRGFYASGIDKYIVVANEGIGISSIVVDTDGINITLGTKVSVGTPSGSGYNNHVVIQLGDNGDHLVLYRTSAGNCMGIIGTVSGYSITYSNLQTVLSSVPGFNDGVAVSSEREGYFVESSSNPTGYSVYVDGGNNVTTASGVSFTDGNYYGIYCTPLTTSSILGVAGIAYPGGTSKKYAAVVNAGASAAVNPTLNGQHNSLGVSQSTVSSGTDCTVVLPGSVYEDPNASYTPGKFYYIDPSTSGVTESSTAPSAWSGAVNWNYLGKAITTSGLLLINSL